MNAGFTASVIQRGLALDWHDLPRKTRDTTRALLLDTLAVGVAGSREPFADNVAALAARWAGTQGTSLVLGRPGQMLPAPYAAFVNGYQIHNQEFDCVHEEAVAHPMATVCSVLLAEAGRLPAVRGDTFLAALVSGVEAVATLGLAAPGSLTFFRPATAGIFGCVVALARLRECSAEEARAALGHALAFASGTMQAHFEGKPTLALQAGAAARSAIEAMDLARCGFPAPDDALEGPFGFFALFEREFDPAFGLRRLGNGYRIDEVSWKPFPTGRAAHGSIQAVGQLASEHGVTFDNLDRLVVRAPPLIARLVGRGAQAGMSVNYARLCLPWLAALALRQGNITLGDFSRERLADTSLLEGASKILVETDGSADWSIFAPVKATASLKDGSSVSVVITQQLGSPDAPMTERQRAAKMTDCLEFAGRLPWREPLQDAIAALDGVPDVHQSLCGAFQEIMPG